MHVRKHLACIWETSDLPTVKGDVGRRGKPKGIADDEQVGGVGQARSVDEATEQSWATSGGDRGEKGPGQGEFAAARHAPDTGPGTRETGAGADTSSGRAREGREVDLAAAPHLRRGHLTGGVLPP